MAPAIFCPASPVRMAQTTAFLTGGTGFIGSHLASALVARGVRVRALVRAAPKWLADVPVEIVRGDLEDAEALREGLAGADYVYHVAGLTRATDEAAFEAGNVTATTRLLDAVREAAPDVRRVLITSSLAAVGLCSAIVATEESPLRPISRYGASKARMEAALAPYHADLPLVVVRPPAVYGPREADIFEFFKTASSGICPVVGDPNVPALSLVHVRDLVAGMIAAAEAPNTAGGLYFLGSAAHHSWAEIRDATARALGRRLITVRVPEALVLPVGSVVETFGRLFGQYPPLNREKAREIRDACKRCAIDKAARDFGYAPAVGLDEGIEETIAWYRREGWLT